MTGDKRDEQTYEIIGAAMEVHKTLGHGFLEAVYQEALEIELKNKNIPYVREQDIPIKYKLAVLKTFYKADFICYNEVVVELKALTKLTGIEEAQVINYLKGTGLKKALLINFGAVSLEYKRMVN